MITIFKFFTYTGKGSLRSLRISQEDGLNRKIAAVDAAIAVVSPVVVVAAAVICLPLTCQQV
jgi:hypothetical protein